MSSVKMTTSDNVHLRRTIYLIDYERCLRMRELEIKRRQFLHQRSNALPCSAYDHDHAARLSNENREELLKKRIQREKDAEFRHQDYLLKRKTELMNKLKTTTPLRRPKSNKKILLAESGNYIDVDATAVNENGTDGGLVEYKTTNKHSQVANLYQRGFDLLKRKKEATKSPFVASVNTILQKLQAQESNIDASGDPFSVLSSNILKKFADDEKSQPGDGLKAGSDSDNDPTDIKSVKDQDFCPACPNENSKPMEHNETLCRLDKLDSGGHTEDGVSRESNATVDKKTLVKKSSTALDLWAKVKKEQALVNRLHRQKENPMQIATSNSTEISKTANENSNVHNVAPIIIKVSQNRDRCPDVSGSNLSPRKSNAGKDIPKATCSSRKSAEKKILTRESKSASTHLTELSTPGKEVLKASYSQRKSPDTKVLNGTHSARKSPETKAVNGTHSARKSPETKAVNGILSPTKSPDTKAMNGTHSPRKSPDPKISTQESKSAFKHHSEDMRRTSVNTPHGSYLSLSSPPFDESESTKKKKARQLEREPSKNVTISLADGCIEEDDETDTPNTVIVVHEDEEDKLQTPIRWYEGHRYSFSEKDNEVLQSGSFFGTLEHHENEMDGVPTSTGVTSKIPMETMKPGEEPQASTSPNLDSQIISTDKGSTECEDSTDSLRPLDSAMSLNTVSEIPSDRRSSVVSRLGQSGRSGKRRLSMQTRGSLRALSGIMKEESRRHLKQQDENVHPESATYKAIFEALAGAAADADEQTRRFENIRMAGLGLKPSDMEVKATESMSSTSGVKDKNEKVAQKAMRRNTISAPGDSLSADVTDPVYKFLQRRSQSKTMRRHKTLSNVELKLLAHAPGEDITGRRHSFSSQKTSRRSSISTVNGETFRRMSVSSSPRKASSDLPVVLENATVQSQRDSVRSRTGSASTRPQSAALSDNDGGLLGLPRETRSYSWAPDVSETKEWHVLAMELLARNNSKVSKYRTVSHMLQLLGEEYRRETASMMYEELRYCSYLRLPKHQQPIELTQCDIESVFASESGSPN